MTKQKIKTLRVSNKQVIKNTPSWFPIDEWGFKSFLIKNPHLIAKDIDFVGYELYYTDLVFQDEEHLYVIEAKCIPHKKVADSQIYLGLAQLNKYYTRLNDRLSIHDCEKQIIPILALMTGHDYRIGKYPLTVKRLKNLKMRIGEAEATLHQYQQRLRDVKRNFLEYNHLRDTNNLPKATAKLKDEYQQLIREVTKLQNEKTSLEFGIHLLGKIQTYEQSLTARLS